MARAPRKQADAARSAALHAETAARRKKTPDGKLLSSYMVQTNGGGSLETVAGFGNRRAIVDGFDSVRLPVPPGYGYEAPPPWPAQPMQPVWLGSVPMPTGSILPVELRPPLPGAGLENVIGPDDRVMIRDPATIPWRCICHLEVIFDNGLKAYGTGWFAGPETVITAGHCVWDPRTDERAAEIRITPGRNGSMGPYGQFVSRKYAVMKGWPTTPAPTSQPSASCPTRAGSRTDSASRSATSALPPSRTRSSRCSSSTPRAIRWKRPSPSPPSGSTAAASRAPRRTTSPT